MRRAVLRDVVRRRRWPRTAARRRPCATAGPGASRRGSRSPSAPGRTPGAVCSRTNGAASMRKPDGAELQPEAHDLLDLLAHRGVGPVQVGLEVVEAVVVPGLGLRVARSRSRSARRGRRCPGGGRRARSSLQTYQSRYGDSGSLRADWNHGCWSDVWLTTRSSRIRMPRCARLASASSAKSPRVPEPRVDAVVVGDVVAVVPAGRGMDRVEPQAGHAEARQVVQPARSGPRRSPTRRRRSPGTTSTSTQ